ncbi:MAG: ExbD/TolR family protein [Chitinophaga sp.]
MAEMNASPDSGSQRGGMRSKKLSTRVDMTPMVDLGFLLITFFMLTTTMSKPKALPLVMPADGESTAVAESKSLTLLVDKHNSVAWYEGLQPDMEGKPLSRSNFSFETGIGNVIRDKQRRVAQAYGDADELVVMIKVADGGSYRNMVDALDEMKINRVARYAVVNITDEEEKMLAE